MCGEDSCKSSHSAWGDADTYAIEPLTQDYPVITGASRTGCPAQTYTFADFHGKSGDWWVGDGSDQRQLPLMGGFSYEEFDEYCTNVRTKPVNGPYGDYHGSAHDWYFTDTGGRHDNGNSGAKQNNIPECQGDCDSDAQCADGLVCFHRESSDGTNPLPSCDGAAQGSAADYCVSEFVLRNVDLDTCKQRCDDDEGCSAFRWKPDGDNNCQISSDGCDARQAADSTGWKSYVLKFDDYTFPCRKYNPEYRGLHRRLEHVPSRRRSYVQLQMQGVYARQVPGRKWRGWLLRLRCRQVLESGWSNQQRRLRRLRCRVLRGRNRQHSLRGVRSREVRGHNWQKLRLGLQRLRRRQVCRKHRHH